MNWLWIFLGHGGFKLVIIALAIAGSFLKGKPKRKVPNSSQPKPIPTAIPPSGRAPRVQQNPVQQNSAQGSPWSNSDPFDEIQK